MSPVELEACIWCMLKTGVMLAEPMLPPDIRKVSGSLASVAASLKDSSARPFHERDQVSPIVVATCLQDYHLSSEGHNSVPQTTLVDMHKSLPTWQCMTQLATVPYMHGFGQGRWPGLGSLPHASCIQ